MKILAIETGTEACSAALLIDGEVSQRYHVEPRRHSELILPMMESLLSDAELSLGQLDALAFGRGPGAFTGVRIATGVVQGVAFAADLPVVPISTLAALAQRAYRESAAEKVLPAFDARMGEVYWGVYQAEDGLVVLDGEESVSDPITVTLPDQGEWLGVGTGWGTYEKELSSRLGDRLLGTQPGLYCSAHDVALLASRDFDKGLAVSADLAYPIYLRDKVADKPKAS